jgi:hypothetical protein
MGIGSRENTSPIGALLWRRASSFTRHMDFRLLSSVTQILVTKAGQARDKLPRVGRIVAHLTF